MFMRSLLISLLIGERFAIESTPSGLSRMKPLNQDDKPALDFLGTTYSSATYVDSSDKTQAKKIRERTTLADDLNEGPRKRFKLNSEYNSNRNKEPISRSLGSRQQLTAPTIDHLDEQYSRFETCGICDHKDVEHKLAHCQYCTAPFHLSCRNYVFGDSVACPNSNCKGAAWLAQTTRPIRERWLTIEPYECPSCRNWLTQPAVNERFQSYMTCENEFCKRWGHQWWITSPPLDQASLERLAENLPNFRMKPEERSQIDFLIRYQALLSPFQGSLTPLSTVSYDKNLQLAQKFLDSPLGVKGPRPR